MGKKQLFFVEGTRAVLTSRLAYKNVISATLYWFFLFILAIPCVG